jgi:hypothetical protein
MLTASSRPVLRDYMAGTVTVAERCGDCRFWVMGEQFGDQPQTDPDERLGSCHRYAPRPTMGDFEYRVLRALMVIMPKDEDGDPTDYWEGAELQRTTWPTTAAEDFCGEFSKRDESC